MGRNLSGPRAAVALEVFAHRAARDLPLGFYWFALEEEKLLEVDVGGVALVAFLVGVGVAHELSFEGDLLAFGEEFFNAFGSGTPGHDLVPVGFLDAVAVGVAVVLVGGHGEAGHFSVVFEGANFGIGAEASDEVDFVCEIVHDVLV